MFSVLLDIKSVQFLYKSRDTDVQVVMRKKNLVFSLEKVMLLSLVAKHQGSQMVDIWTHPCVLQAPVTQTDFIKFKSVLFMKCQFTRTVASGRFILERP